MYRTETERNYGSWHCGWDLQRVSQSTVGQPRCEASSLTGSSPKLVMTCTLSMAGSHPTSTVWDACCAPQLWVLRGLLEPCAQRDFLKGPLPREQHNANYSSSVRRWDLHVCGRAKGQTSAAAFSHNTRKLGGLPVERQGIKC